MNLNFSEWIKLKESYVSVGSFPEFAYTDIEEEMPISKFDFEKAVGRLDSLTKYSGAEFYKGTFRGTPAYFMRLDGKKEVFTLGGKLNQPKPQMINQRQLNQAFWAWFSGSKVVDKDGNPLMVYHGTNNKFDEFDYSPYDLGFHFGSIDAAHSVFDSKSDGFKKVKAPWDGRNIKPVYLSIKNPLRLKDLDYFDTRTLGPELEKMGLVKDGKNWANEIYEKAKKSVIDKIQEMPHHAGRELINLQEKELTRKALEDMGYDGIVYNNDFEGGGDSWVAFRKNQIKSAIGNQNFDPNSPKIHESLTSSQK